LSGRVAGRKTSRIFLRKKSTKSPKKKALSQAPDS